MKDLTVGNPQSVLLKFSLPLLGSMVFQQLYNIADSFVAGKFIGENALAAVGNGYEVTLIYLSFAFGCNMGCSVVLGHLFGAKQFKSLKTCITTSFISTFVICLILMVFGFLFIPKLLMMINTPSEIFADTVLYLKIYTAGLIFLFFYNVSNAIFSALGDSKIPFYFLAVSSTVNIFMDIWFVKSFGWGIAGLAWATFLCQAVSCVVSVIAVFIKIHRLHIEKKFEVFSWSLFLKMLYVGVPSTLQQCFVSIGNIFIQSFVNSCGTYVIAGYSAAIKINNFVVTSLATLGNAISCFTSQNVGAKQFDRIPKCFSAGLRLALLMALVESVLCIVFRNNLIDLFTQDNRSGVDFLLIVAPFFFLVATKLTSDGILRGAAAMSCFMTTTFLDLILRVILAYVFCILLGWGYIGIWLAWPVGWGLSATVSVVFYLTGVWKKNLL